MYQTSIVWVKKSLQYRWNKKKIGGVLVKSHQWPQSLVCIKSNFWYRYQDKSL